MFQKQTPLLVAINIVLIVLLYYLTKPALVNRELSKNKRALVIVFSFFFCIFSFWGADWFHYLNLFESIKKNGATRIRKK